MMTPNRITGLMALGDAFGSLASIGSGRPYQSRALPLMLAQSQQAAQRDQAMAALAGLGVSPAGAPQGAPLGLPLGPGAGIAQETSRRLGFPIPDAVPAQSANMSPPSAPQAGPAPGGLPPQIVETARALAANDPAQAMQFVADYRMRAATQGPAKQPSSVQEYEYARGQGFNGSYSDWVRNKASAGADSVNVYNGDNSRFDTGKIPPGYRVDRATGVMSPIPGSEVEKGQRKATEDAINTSQEMIDSIESILNDEALPYSTGVFGPLQNVPGTGSYRFGTRARQLQGQAFLQAIETLKGSGQITEIEGKKATEAIGRLDTGMSEEDYRAALTELLGILREGQGRALQGGVSDRVAPDFSGMSLDDLRALEGRLSNQ